MNIQRSMDIYPMSYDLVKDTYNRILRSLLQSVTKREQLSRYLFENNLPAQNYGFLTIRPKATRYSALRGQETFELLDHLRRSHGD